MFNSVIVGMHAVCMLMARQANGVVQASTPRYECVAPPSMTVTLPLLLLRDEYANGKLAVMGTGDPTDITSNDLGLFRQLLSSCESRHTNEFSVLLRDIENNPSVTTVWLYQHPSVAIAGKPNSGAHTAKYFLDIHAFLVFPDVAPATHDWATTRCMVLAHELREALKGDHAHGIDEENALRGRPPYRSGQGELRHGDHCDLLIPIGDHLERLHLLPSSRRLDRITYQ